MKITCCKKNGSYIYVYETKQTGTNETKTGQINHCKEGCEVSTMESGQSTNMRVLMTMEILK